MAEPSSHFSFWFNPLILAQVSVLSRESHSAIVFPHSFVAAQWLQMCTLSVQAQPSQVQQCYPQAVQGALSPNE